MWQKLIEFFKNLFSKNDVPPAKAVEVEVIEKPVEILDSIEHKNVIDISRGSLAYYNKLWNSAALRKEMNISVTKSVIRIKDQQSRYRFVQRELGVPWQLVGAIHGLESSFNFNTCLHNGDKLGVKTVHVPAGRGPFFTWEQAAIDALKLKHFDAITAWNIAMVLKQAELYNGLGYLNKHQETNSPYLWSGTTLYSQGKYVADGKYDPIAVSKQIGVAAILLKFKEINQLEIPEV